MSEGFRYTLAEAEVTMDEFMDSNEDIQSYTIGKGELEDSHLWFVWIQKFDWDGALPFGSGLDPLDAVMDALETYERGVAVAE